MAIADLPHAELREVSPNEIGFDQKRNPDGTATWDDPTKLRFGAALPADGRTHFYLGCIGADVLAGSRQEKIFLAFKLDNTAGQPALPCLEIYAQRTAETDSDADMLCICRISSRGIELDPKGAGGMSINVPVTSTPPSFMRSPDGRYQTHMQGDGNFVTYDTSVTPWKALWSAWHGRI